MQTSISLSQDGKYYVFQGPYNGAANANYHMHKGKWRNKRWLLPVNAETTDFIQRFYGEGNTETTVQVALDSMKVTPFESQIVLGGYVLAGRMFAKGKVHLGEGVRLVSGTFDEVSPSGTATVSWTGPAPVVELKVRADYAVNNGLYSVPVPDEQKRPEHNPEPQMPTEPVTDPELEELTEALRKAPGWRCRVFPNGEVTITKDKTDSIIAITDADVLISREKITLAKRKALVWRALEIISALEALNK